MIGPFKATGKGLLTNRVFQVKDLIDEFIIHLGDGVLNVMPKQAKITMDSRVMFVGNPNVFNELIWFRRMEQQIASWDINSRAAQCLWYGVGLKWPTGQHGYRLYEDGKLTGESIA